MASAKRFIEWFTAAASPLPLAKFRVAVALFCLIRFWVVAGSAQDVYGQYGFIQWAITKSASLPGLPHLGDVAIWLAPLGLSAEETVLAVLAGFHLGAVLLFLGLFTRASALLCWSLHGLLLSAGGGMVYGMDMFTHLAFFYCFVMPCGAALSLDAIRARRPIASSTAAGVTRRMLQVHLCLVYFSAGFEKALGEQWWNGEAVWRSLTMPTFRQFDLTWLAWQPWIPTLLGWLTLATEILYVGFIWPRRTRKVWLSATIGMHAFIAVFLGLWLFAAIMVVLNLGAFGF
jgi:hypothetical protein